MLGKTYWEALAGNQHFYSILGIVITSALIQCARDVDGMPLVGPQW